MTTDAGYVYILTNPSFREDWVKIGRTTNIEKRLSNLDTTPVPLPFEVYATMKTTKYIEAEKVIHHQIERFTKLRVRDNREFFKISPEEALAIFRDVATLLDDAEIDEVHKKAIMGDAPVEKNKKTPHRSETKEWIIPANSKFFDLDGCFKKYGEVYWTQYFNFQKGDTGYVYCSSPDSAILYKFSFEGHDLPYDPDMDKEIEFYVDAKDFENSKRKILQLSF